MSCVPMHVLRKAPQPRCHRVKIMNNVRLRPIRMSENVSVNVAPQYHLEYLIRDIDSLIHFKPQLTHRIYESIELRYGMIN